MPATLDELMTFCRREIDPRDMERLVGWIAWRTGRNQAMAGAGAPDRRLEHAAANWLDDALRGRLLEWLERRVEEGRPPVPD